MKVNMQGTQPNQGQNNPDMRRSEMVALAAQNSEPNGPKISSGDGMSLLHFSLTNKGTNIEKISKNYPRTQLVFQGWDKNQSPRLPDL